jgi:hypothetical protein
MVRAIAVLLFIWGGSLRFWLNRFSVHYKLTEAKDFQGAPDFVNSLFPYNDLGT